MQSESTLFYQALCRFVRLHTLGLIRRSNRTADVLQDRCTRRPSRTSSARLGSRTDVVTSQSKHFSETSDRFFSRIPVGVPALSYFKDRICIRIQEISGHFKVKRQKKQLHRRKRSETCLFWGNVLVYHPLCLNNVCSLLSTTLFVVSSTTPFRQSSELGIIFAFSP